MATVSEKFDEVLSCFGDMADKALSYLVISSYLNLIDDAVDELCDDEVSNKFGELQDLIEMKQKEFLQMEA